MAYERIGEKPRDQVMVNGHRAVYVAQDALAVRVTVRRDGLTKSADVEVISPDTDGWSPVVLEAVHVDGSAESGRVGAVLTFPSGERVTIGAPEESLRASALCVEPAASASAREEPAQPARWWQIVGAWGAMFGAGPVTIEPCQVVQIEGDRGAWVRSMAGVIALAQADRLDGMKPIAAPPDAALRGADEDRELRARINRIRSAAAQAIAPEDAVSFVQDLLRGDL